MSRGNRRRGYTLIEALVAVAVAAIGITASLGAMSALNKGELRARERETMQRLAFEKYDDAVATHDYTLAPLSGDFADHNLPNYSYRLEIEPSGVENLDVVHVTVTSTTSNLQATAEGLVFTAPQTQEGAQ